MNGEPTMFEINITVTDKQFTQEEWMDRLGEFLCPYDHEAGDECPSGSWMLSSRVIPKDDGPTMPTDPHGDVHPCGCHP